MKRNLLKLWLTTVILPLLLTACISTPTKFDNPPPIDPNLSYEETMHAFFKGTADYINIDDIYIYEIPFYRYANNIGNEYVNEYAAISKFASAECKKRNSELKFERHRPTDMKSSSVCTINNKKTRVIEKYSTQGRIAISVQSDSAIKQENADRDKRISRKIETEIKCFQNNLARNDSTNKGVVVSFKGDQVLVLTIPEEEYKLYPRSSLYPESNSAGLKVRSRNKDCESQ